MMPAAGAGVAGYLGLEGGAATATSMGVNAAFGAGYTYAVNTALCQPTTPTDLFIGALGGAVSGLVGVPSGARRLPAGSTASRLILPAGTTKSTLDDAISLLRQQAEAKGYAGDVKVHGSRVGGSPRVDSDFDFAIRVTPEEFDRIAQARLATLKPGGNRWDTIQHGINVGKLQRGEIGLRAVGKQMQEMLGVDIDISVIRIGGEFDQGPWYP